MGRGSQDATDRRAVAGVSVGVEHKIGDTGRAAGVERLFQAGRIETGANGVRADDGDRFALVTRRGDEAGGVASDVDLGWVVGVH